MEERSNRSATTSALEGTLSCSPQVGMSSPPSPGVSTLIPISPATPAPLGQLSRTRTWTGTVVALQFSSVQFSRSVVSDSLRPHGLQHARPPYPSPTPWVYSHSCPLSQWCHPTISSSVIPFSSCLQFFPALRRCQTLKARWFETYANM